MKFNISVSASSTELDQTIFSAVFLLASKDCLLQGTSWFKALLSDRVRTLNFD